MAANNPTTNDKRILVLGGTGAQGFAVVNALLHSGFGVRILSRNPSAPSVQKAFEDLPQVEFVRGSFMDFDAVERALQGCYGVYVNTDGFTVKESDEIWAGIRIFEIANTISTLRHFVYGSIDYYLQLTGFDHKYAAHHTNAKGRVNAYLQSQTSSTSDTGLTWSILNTAVYNEDLLGGPLTPVITSDGVRHIALPLGSTGHIPFLTLRDLGFFAAALFLDRLRWSGITLNAASHFATGNEIAATLAKVASVEAVYEDISVQRWGDEVLGKLLADAPVASMDPEGTTVLENFAMWWPGFQNSVLLEKGTRDMSLLKQVHPGLESLEGWMRRVGFDGRGRGVLKGWTDAGVGPPAADIQGKVGESQEWQKRMS